MNTTQLGRFILTYGLSTFYDIRNTDPGDVLTALSHHYITFSLCSNNFKIDSFKSDVLLCPYRERSVCTYTQNPKYVLYRHTLIYYAWRKVGWGDWLIIILLLFSNRSLPPKCVTTDNSTRNYLSLTLTL